MYCLSLKTGLNQHFPTILENLVVFTVIISNSKSLYLDMLTHTNLISHSYSRTDIKTLHEKIKLYFSS